MFDQTTKDGIVDFLDFSSMLRDVAVCNPSKAELDNAYEILTSIAIELGFGPNKPGLNVNQWIVAKQKFGIAELARNKRGEPMLFKAFHSVMFDIVDTNKDGWVTLEEFTVMCQAHARVDDAKCKIAFDIIDQNKDGVLSRKEYVDTYFDFFFSNNDINLFGDNHDINWTINIFIFNKIFTLHKV